MVNDEVNNKAINIEIKGKDGVNLLSVNELQKYTLI